MHNHDTCKHELKYCKICDVCYCEKCNKEWKYFTLNWSYYPDTYVYKYNPQQPYKITWGDSSSDTVVSVAPHKHLE